MKIVVTSVLVDDQEKALRFYTDVLGFLKKTDIPMGHHRWLTVVSTSDPDGVELLLEPGEHLAAKPFKKALVEDGIPKRITSSEAVSLSIDVEENRYANLFCGIVLRRRFRRVRRVRHSGG